MNQEGQIRRKKKKRKRKKKKRRKKKKKRKRKKDEKKREKKKEKKTRNFRQQAKHSSLGLDLLQDYEGETFDSSGFSTEGTFIGVHSRNPH